MQNSRATTLEFSVPLEKSSGVDVVSEPLESPSKPKRKWAPRKVRVGVSKGMVITLYPTEEQSAILRRWIGSTRWVWNWALSAQEAYYREHEKHLSTTALSTLLTELRSKEATLWLSLVSRASLTQTLLHLNTAWKNYFEGLSGKRKGKPPGRPVFRRRGGSRETIAFQVDPRIASPIDLRNPTLHLTGIGKVPAVFPETVPGVITRITVRQKGTQWRAALTLVDIPAERVIRKPEKTKVFSDPLDPTGMAAIDGSVPFGGVATGDGQTTYSLATAADRERADAKLKKKKRYQRKASRKQDCRLIEQGLDPRKPIPKGTRLPKSKRQEALQQKIAMFDLRALFARNDRIHKFTTELVRNHHTIVVETLCLAGMAQVLSKGFRRRFHEAAMGEIIRQLKYKCAWYGRTLIFVDKWFPSSKRCSNPDCHQKNKALKLSDRAWECPHCHTVHERDSNAAFNLWQEGWRLLKQQQPPLTDPPVGSTERQARRAEEVPLAAPPGQVAAFYALKRESSSCSLPTKTGMEPVAVGSG